MSSRRSKSTMPSSAWEDCQSCSTTAHLSIPTPASPSEDTPFLSSAKRHRKLKEDKNLFPRLCFSSCWLVVIRTTNSSKHFPMSGRAEAVWLNKKQSLSLLFPESTTQWRCFQWPFWISRIKVSSLRLTTGERIKPSSGNTTTKMRWTCWQKCLTFVPPSIVINITTPGSSPPTTPSTGLATLHTCLAIMSSKCNSASEDTFPSTPTTKEATSQHTPMS